MVEKQVSCLQWLNTTFKTLTHIEIYQALSFFVSKYMPILWAHFFHFVSDDLLNKRATARWHFSNNLNFSTALRIVN